jgi:hypothetical protein
MASARSGDSLESAKFAGQIDILSTILDLPQKTLDKAMKKQEPVAANMRFAELNR